MKFAKKNTRYSSVIYLVLKGMLYFLLIHLVEIQSNKQLSSNRLCENCKKQKYFHKLQNRWCLFLN